MVRGVLLILHSFHSLPSGSKVRAASRFPASPFVFKMIISHGRPLEKPLGAGGQTESPESPRFRGCLRQNASPIPYAGHVSSGSARFPHGPHAGEGPGILPAHPARRPRSHRCTRDRPPRRSNGRFSPFPPAAKTLLPLLHHELGHWTSAKRNTRLIPVLVIQIHKAGAETFQRSVRAALYLLLQIFSAVNMRFCSNRDFMAERNQRLVRRFLIAPRSATLRSVKMGQPISWAIRIGRIASSLGGNAPWP